MPVGKTKDAGWEIGVSRTVPRPLAEVWDLLISPAGLAIWLGQGVDLPAGAGTGYETAAGTAGQIRSFRPLDRIRLTWRPDGWTHESTVQVALVDRGDRTRIVFHQDHLASSAERERQREHWQGVLGALLGLLDAPG